MQKVFSAYSFIRNYLRRYQVGIYAGNCAFFILLSLFPALMLFFGLLKYTPISQAELLAAAYAFVPKLFHPLLQYFIDTLFSGGGITLISVSAIGTAWTASRGVYSFLTGLNKIYHCPERRGYFFQRIMCLFDTLLLFIALFITIICYVFGKRIRVLLSKSMIPIARLAVFLLRMRWLALTLMLWFLFLIVFTLFPSKRQKVRFSLPGAFAAAVGWVGFSAGYVFYAERFGRYDSVYGSLATVALAMVWLYACISILFYAALLNRFSEVWRRKRKELR